MRYGINIVFAFVATVLTTASVNAQDSIREVPAYPTDKTMVRNITANRFLVYHELSGSGNFGIDYGTSTFRSASVPMGCGIVNDIEIVEGEIAFFCGKNWGAPVFVWFNINDFVGSNVTYNIIHIPNPLNDFHITNLTKLTAYNTAADTGYHVIMVGEGKYNAYGDPTTYYCIIDCYTADIASNNWQLTATNYYKYYLQFDDVDKSSRFIGVSSRRRDYDMRQRVYFFNRPTNGSTSIFSTTPYIHYCESPYASTTPSLIKNTEADKFVCATHFIGSSGNSELILSLYDASSYSNTMRKALTLSSANFSGPVKDITVDMLGNTLFIVQDLTVSSNPNWSELIVNLSSFAPMTTKYNLSGTNLNSLNSVSSYFTIPNMTLASGISTSGNLALFYSRYHTTPSSCYNLMPFTNTTLDLDNNYEEQMPTVMAVPTVSSFQKPVVSKTYLSICR
ncbi:MAG: hypothetical protein K5650_05035 [Bacteroidales bacterium]|nr:hypothetical protein [Bacteroidales bacterium]